MLTRPILNKIPTFDAHNEAIITFNVVGGNQIVGHNLVVERIRDNAQMYNGSSDSFNLRHVLPADSLTNGEDYKAKIRTKDINANWSPFSNIEIFWCYSKPTINILTIDYENQNRVYNQTVTFEAIYSQSESEILQSYRFLLYNSNKELLYSYSEHFADEGTNLNQEIAGLENDLLYYLEVITFAPSGNKGSSGLIPFKPLYLSPRLVASIDPYPLPSMGAIKVESNITQILLKLYDDSGNEISPLVITYEDGEWLNLNNSIYDKLVADEGFYILQENFMFQLWCKGLPENKVFMTLFSNEGKIEMLKRNNKIIVYKRINNSSIFGYFGSNDFVATEADVLSIYMKQVNGLLDLKVEIVS